MGSITDEINTLISFKKKINDLGHFHSVYINIDNLLNQFRNQLDKFLPQVTGNAETITTNLGDGQPSASVKNTFTEKLTRGLIGISGLKVDKAGQLFILYINSFTLCHNVS